MDENRCRATMLTNNSHRANFIKVCVIRPKNILVDDHSVKGNAFNAGRIF